MKFIIGKKLEMTQVWQGDEVVAVTKVQAGPCTVTQVKTEEKDGYKALQLGFGERKEKNIKKPQIGHLKGLGNIKNQREFRIEENLDIVRGDVVSVDTFEAGDLIDVIGTSKGKGFQGVVKRHGFKGSKKTHGNKDQLRMPGSIGATGPAHVFKGTRMGGRMGGDRVTTKNTNVIEVDTENNIILVKGSVPGARNGLVMLVCKEGELKFSKSKIDDKKENKESKKEEVRKEEVRSEKNNDKDNKKDNPSASSGQQTEKKA